MEKRFSDYLEEGIELPPENRAAKRESGAAKAVPEEYMPMEDIEHLRERMSVSLEKNRQDIARWLLLGIVGALCLVAVTAQLVGLFRREMTAENISKALLDILQPVIFALLGFLFGEKAAQDKKT